MVANSDATRWLNVRLEHRSGTESTMTVHVCHTARFACRHALQAVEDEHSEQPCVCL